MSVRAGRGDYQAEHDKLDALTREFDFSRTEESSSRSQHTNSISGSRRDAYSYRQATGANATYLNYQDRDRPRGYGSSHGERDGNRDRERERDRDRYREDDSRRDSWGHTGKKRYSTDQPGGRALEDGRRDRYEDPRSVYGRDMDRPEDIQHGPYKSHHAPPPPPAPPPHHPPLVCAPTREKSPSPWEGGSSSPLGPPPNQPGFRSRRDAPSEIETSSTGVQLDPLAGASSIVTPPPNYSAVPTPTPLLNYTPVRQASKIAATRITDAINSSLGPIPFAPAPPEKPSKPTGPSPKLYLLKLSTEESVFDAMKRLSQPSCKYIGERVRNTVPNALANPNYHVLIGNDRCDSCRNVVDPPDLPPLYERWPCAGIQMADGTFKHACLSCASRRVGNCKIKPAAVRLPTRQESLPQRETLPQSSTMATSVPRLGTANPSALQSLYFSKGEGEDEMKAMKREILNRFDSGDRDRFTAILTDPKCVILTGPDRCQYCRDITAENPPDHQRWPCAGVRVADGTFKHSCLSCGIRKQGGCDLRYAPGYVRHVPNKVEGASKATDLAVVPGPSVLATPADESPAVVQARVKKENESHYWGGVLEDVAPRVTQAAQKMQNGDRAGAQQDVDHAMKQLRMFKNYIKLLQS